ncbi:HAD family hydrolase [Metabacillus dongyingensis]|uniref:HAD family hydrolase n=1 Tax=Metabacillus dongyingensis TaxID=2874282 RepID=UPI003B8C8002
MPIKAIVFDMDDTLYYEKDYVKSGFKEIEKWIIERYHVEGFYNVAIDIFNKGERKYIFNETLNQLNIKYNEESIENLINIYRLHNPSITLLNDSKWVLDHLHKKVKVGLISDGYFDVQANKVHALGIKDQFDSIVLSDQFGRAHWKPSYKPYELTVKNLEVSHSECMYIGDNVIKDFITAKKLGWKTVHIEREIGVYKNILKKQEYLAHYKINNLKKLSMLPEFKHLFITTWKEAL